MDADFALSLENTSEPPTPRRARTVMVRKALRGDSQRLELESSETSRGRAVMLAHRMHPGQTTKLVSRQGVRGTLNDEEFTRSQPESVALTRADQRQPGAEGGGSQRASSGEDRTYERKGHVGRIRPVGGGSAPRVTSSETASKLGVNAAGSPWGPPRNK